jgi:hypothetical protein
VSELPAAEEFGVLTPEELADIILVDAAIGRMHRRAIDTFAPDHEFGPEQLNWWRVQWKAVMGEIDYWQKKADSAERANDLWRAKVAELVMENEGLVQEMFRLRLINGGLG